MAVNGKQKGNTFERNIANELSERFCESTGIEKSFRRNPDSGAFFGGSNHARTETYDTEFAVYGDLICPRHFKYSVECKHYKTAPPLSAVLKQKVTQWDTWLKQATQDAEVSEKEMLMIVKYNNTPAMAFVDDDLEGAIDPIFYYNGYIVYVWEHMLALGDKQFFNKG